MKKILFFQISHKGEKDPVEMCLFKKDFPEETPSVGSKIHPLVSMNADPFKNYYMVGIVDYPEYFLKEKIIKITARCEMNPIDYAKESQRRLIKEDMKRQGWKFISSTFRN